VTRALLVIAFLIALVVCVFITIGVVSHITWKRAGSEPWPVGLGTLEQVEARNPVRADSEAALHLAELARPFAIDLAEHDPKDEEFEDFSDYPDVQHASPHVTITEPPAEIVSFLDKHEHELDAVRDWLLTHSGAIHWQVTRGKGNLLRPGVEAHVTLANLFASRAVVRARQRDARAWDDVHAILELVKVLQAQPDLYAQQNALALAKFATGLAWKCPLPVPEWFANAEPADERRLLLTAMQYETWLAWKFWPHIFGGNYARHQRESARQLAQVSNCGFDGGAFITKREVDLPLWNVFGSVSHEIPDWRRVARLTVEREATLNALRIRSGQPIVERSQCPDGSWRYANKSLTFSIDLPKPKGEVVMQLPLVDLVPDDAAAGDH
jgi:hypothetical protein